MDDWDWDMFIVGDIACKVTVAFQNSICSFTQNPSKQDNLTPPTLQMAIEESIGSSVNGK